MWFSIGKRISGEYQVIWHPSSPVALRRTLCMIKISFEKTGSK